MATVIYDFETSGLNPHTEDVIEIGARCIDNGVQFQTLVIPLSKKSISSKITEITGITDEILRNQGLKTTVAFKRFFNYLHEIYTEHQGITLIAHNGMQFDDIFLRRMHKYILNNGATDYVDMFNHMIFIDSLMVCRYIHPNRRYHNMKEMCMIYNVKNNQAHRSMGDVDALCEIWNYLVQHLKNMNIDTSGEGLKKQLYYY